MAALVQMWKDLLAEFPVAIYATSFIIVAVTIFWLLSSRRTQANGGKDGLPHPPGSMGLPLIGETLEFASSTGSDVGYREWMMKKVTNYGPFFKTHILGKPMVVMDPPAGNKFLFQNEGKFVEVDWPVAASRLLGPDSLSVKVGEPHKLARRHLGAFFNHAAVVRYIEGVERSAVNHFEEHWEGKEEILAQNLLRKFTFVTMCNLLMTLDAGPEMDEFLVTFKRWAKGILSLAINLPGFAFHDAFRARKTILEMLGKVIARRKRELEEGRVSETAKVDVLTSLLTVPIENGKLCSESEIKDNLLLFLFAGYDTSSSALSMTISYIAKNPHVYQELLQEHKSILERKREEGVSEALTEDDLSAMKYTWMVLQETLRLQPPVAATFRSAITDFEYHGCTVPKGWRLMWNNQLSHYNPAFFKHPLTFDPSRWEEPPTPFTFLPFGGGQRLCAGYEFAKMEMLVFLHHLLKRYQWNLLDPDAVFERNPMPTSSKGMPIRITKISLDL